MSRSGYSDECDGWDLIRWRGAVASAIRGKRGQEFLRELAEALDAMPEKRLIASELESAGEFCALGVVGAARGLDMTGINIEDRSSVANAFGIAEAMAAEIMFENDGGFCHWSDKTPEQRWQHMRSWVQSQMKP